MKIYTLKNFSIVLAIVLFFTLVVCKFHDLFQNGIRVKEVISPLEIILENGDRLNFSDYQIFDSYYSDNLYY